MNKTKEMCRGCREDHYNHAVTGGCWSFKSAKIVTRTQVGTWQNPPYRWIPTKTLSCHRAQGKVWIEKDDCRIVAT